jgi:hypothetical protein
MIGDAIALLDFLRRMYGDYKIISTLFDADGVRIEGDEEIVVHVHKEPGHPNEWYYSVEPIEGYQFVRIPMNAGAVIESLASLEGFQTLDASYFRYVPVPDGLLRWGGVIPNVRVQFMVFAYKTSDLLALGKGKVY